MEIPEYEHLRYSRPNHIGQDFLFLYVQEAMRSREPKKNYHLYTRFFLDIFSRRKKSDMRRRAPLSFRYLLLFGW